MHALATLATPKLLMEAGAIGGDVLWLIAYILIARKGFQDRTYGVPAVALALNFTWEIMYTIQFRPTDWPHIILRWSWLLADCVIVGQYFRFGKENCELPALKPYFYVLAVFALISAYVVQLTFHYHFNDFRGYLDAFLINCLMSLLFVRFYFVRPQMQGLSYGAAWCKMIGTAVLATVYATQLPAARDGFMLYVYASTFLYDLVYVVLLARRRAAALGTSA